MTKILPYILGMMLLACIVFLFNTAEKNNNRIFVDKVTLNKRDKIPYGTYVAFQNLKYIFPRAAVVVDKEEPGYWDSLSVNRSHQAVLMIAPSFFADEGEMKRLIDFAAAGNDVFVSAYNYSYDADKMISAALNRKDISHYYPNTSVYNEDSLVVSLLDPPYRGGYREYTYPGKKGSDYFHDLNSSTAQVYGNDAGGAPCFIHLRSGKGNLYFHRAPLAFSNYFLLHRNNIEYYEKALSVIDPDIDRLVWNEYYLFKKLPFEKNTGKKGWFGALMAYRAFRAAFLTAIFLLLLYTLLEMRRKQRMIPQITAPRNDSLDFVKTIGRLYYDTGDHGNLCAKMAAYFLEHVRSKYKLATGTLDESFIRNLQYKSGAAESLLRGIVSFINELYLQQAVSRQQLTGFYRQLEEFYKTT